MAEQEKEGVRHVVIIGAGAIGGLVGCCLYQRQQQDATSNLKVTMLVRNQAQLDHYAKVTGFSAASRKSTIGSKITIPTTDIRNVFTTNPQCLEKASLVAVATKRTANHDIHRLLVEHHVACPVVFLQNGMEIYRDLIAKKDDDNTPSHPVPPGRFSHSSHQAKASIPYQVIESIVMMPVQLDKHTGIVTLGLPWNRTLVVLDGSAPSAISVGQKLLSSPKLHVQVHNPKHHSFLQLQAAKIQINMMNAVNALAGVSIAETASQSGYRRVHVAAIEEYRAVLQAYQVVPQAVGPDFSNLRLRLMPLMKYIPDIVIRIGLLPKRKILQGKSSMAQDLEQGNAKTEIDYLNGTIVAMGREVGIATPVNQRLVELIQQAEVSQSGSPKLSAQELVEQVGLISSSCTWLSPCYVIPAFAIAVSLVWGKAM